MIASPAVVFAFAAVASPTFALAHLLAQQVFNLRIDAAQVVGRPSLDIVVEIGREAEQKGLTCRSHVRYRAFPC